jgi:phosphatidate cytidylyltransferase
LIVYFLPSELFALVVLAVFMIGAWEWARLTRIGGTGPRLVYLAIVLGVAALAWWSSVHAGSIGPIAIGGLWWLVVLVVLAVREPGRGLPVGGRIAYRVAGVLTLVPAWIALVLLHREGWRMVLFLVVLNALADTAAYFSGKAFGRTKLAPSISPGKTREGLLGALATSVLAGLAGAWLLQVEPGLWFYFIGVCVVTTLFSVTGDLFESLVKREAGKKDSGRILPGHGGVLDRIDSLTAAAPAFALGLLWLR